MLQINSGKLFTCEAEYRNELRGILHTNLVLRHKTIETVAGRLLPLGTLRNPRAIIYEVTELIEAGPAPGVIASHGAEPYLQDFATVASFALMAICTPDAGLAQRLISDQQGVGLLQSPRTLVKRVFDDKIWVKDRDAEHLSEFVNRLIGLERRSYLATMRAMRTFVTGLHRMADDLELSYTLLVASLESLAQGFDGHRASWSDYDEAKRKAIDVALKDADKGAAERVREALLGIEHVSLSRRFRDFTLSHLRPSFFREETIDQQNPIGRSELPGALQEAYRLRSKYIHNLQELPRVLALGADTSETVTDGRVRLLTFQGLIRLARHVIEEFVNRQPKVEREAYDYHLERPGIVQVPMAAEYWVGQADGLTPTMGRSRLEGFLEQFAGYLRDPHNAKFTDLRDVLAAAETMLPTMKADQRRPYVALYLLFGLLLPPPDRMPGFEVVRAKYGPDLDLPSVESLLVHLLLGEMPAWKVPKLRETHDAYFKRRDQANGIRMARDLEAGLSLMLAERYRSVDDLDRARELIAFAVENHPGDEGLRSLEESFEGATIIGWQAMFDQRGYTKQQREE